MKRSPLKRTGRLSPLGKRGRRLSSGDRAVTASVGGQPCVCGCDRPTDPAHLESRRYESTRHNPLFLVPLCKLGHNWLDQESQGVQCRRVLFEMAGRKQSPLDRDDFIPVADTFGLYGWLERQGY